MMISIIVPVYNSEKYIDRCLDSILNQTYKDLEIVLVNDGSNDQSLKILENYALRDTRIKVVNQENKGVAAARNTGLDNATGDYILYVDSDDWIENNMVERMVELSANADIVFCGNDNAVSPESVKKIIGITKEIWNKDKIIYEFLRHKIMSGMLWNKLIKRSLTDGCRFNPKTGYGEDAEFLWQVLQNTNSMIVTNEILYHHVPDENSISHLSYSEKKYSAISMWEKINADTSAIYPEYLKYARISLTSAAVFGLFEARQCCYKNKNQLKYMRSITRKNIGGFLKADYISKKFKVYAIVSDYENIQKTQNDSTKICNVHNKRG